VSVLRTLPFWSVLKDRFAGLGFAQTKSLKNIFKEIETCLKDISFDQNVTILFLFALNLFFLE
jgi:hypothetical protein